MTKQELVNELKRHLRGIFKEFDLTVGEHRAMKHHLEDFMSVSKPVTQGERFVKLIDKDGRKNLIRVSAIVNIKNGGNLAFTVIEIMGRKYSIEVNTKDNEEVLENLIADLKG